jgi:hypothetical protein
MAEAEKTPQERAMDRTSSPIRFVLLAYLTLGVGYPASLAEDRKGANAPLSSKPRLSLSEQGIILAMPGREPRRYSSLADLLQEVPELEGEFVIGGREPSQKKAPGTKKAVRADPARKGKAIRIEAGEIPVLEFARFLADYTGLPVVHDSRDKGLSDGVIVVPAPIDAADDELVRKILSKNHVRVTERQVGTRRAIILESLDASSGSGEPEEDPIVIVGGLGTGRSGTPARRVARGPEAPTGTYAGLTLGPVPDMVRAQIDLAEGRGVMVVEVDEKASKKRPEVALLKSFDIVTHVRDVPVSTAEKFVDAVNSVGRGESFYYRLLRKGTTKILRAEKGP